MNGKMKERKEGGKREEGRSEEGKANEPWGKSPRGILWMSMWPAPNRSLMTGMENERDDWFSLPPDCMVLVHAIRVFKLPHPHPPHTHCSIKPYWKRIKCLACTQTHFLFAM